MDQFIAQHADKLQGILSCFDRVLFRGYLPFFSGYTMASFLEARKVDRRDVKQFVLTRRIVTPLGRRAFLETFGIDASTQGDRRKH